MDKAHLVLSAASFAESDGTVVNNEVAPSIFQVYDPAYDAKTVMLESWRWLHSLQIGSHQVDWTQLDPLLTLRLPPPQRPVSGTPRRMRPSACGQTGS